MNLDFYRPSDAEPFAVKNDFDSNDTKEDILEFYTVNKMSLNDDFYFTMIDGVDYGCEGTLEEIAEYLEIANESCNKDYEDIYHAMRLKNTAVLDEYYNFKDLLFAVCNGYYDTCDLDFAENFDEIPDDVIEYMRCFINIPEPINNLLTEKGITDKELVKSMLGRLDFWSVDYKEGIAWKLRW